MSKRNYQPTLSGLSDLVKGKTAGESQARFTGLASIDSASEYEIGVLIDSNYLSKIETTKAGALLVSEELSSKVPPGICKIITKNPRKAVAMILTYFHPAPEIRKGVHQTAIIDKNIVTGKDFTADPYVVIERDVNLGDRVRLHSHVVIHQGAKIGNNVTIHPHVVIYHDVQIGNNVTIFAGARIGVDGFGYVDTDEGSMKIPHVGGCILGDEIEIGANTCIDRGSLANTEIGSGVKIDNLVHIAHNVIVGNDSLIAAQVGVAGSTILGSGTIWGGQSGASEHLTIGDRTKVAAKSGVTEDTLADSEVAGFPSRNLKRFLKAQSYTYRLEELWNRLRQIEKEQKKHFKEPACADDT